MSRPGRWQLQATGVPGDLQVEGHMAGGAAPMPFPVPVREDRVTDEDLKVAEAALIAGYDDDGVADSDYLARAVCEALLKGGRR